MWKSKLPGLPWSVEELAALKAAITAGLLLVAASAWIAVTSSELGPVAEGGASSAVQTVTGEGFHATLLADGSVWFTTTEAEARGGKVTRVHLLQDIAQVAAEGRRLYARQTDGRVWSWEPRALAMPRPVVGLPGKVIALEQAADGGLELQVTRSAFVAAEGRVTQQQVRFRLDGPFAVAMPAVRGREGVRTLR